jgi:alkylation response protein AidB-like acyl-CoA dehydrogenase
MTAPFAEVEVEADVEADGGRADTPEQASFREEVRGFLSAHARPRGPGGMWAVGFHTDAAAQARSFEVECGWQRTMFDHRMAGLTYPVELGGRGGTAWHETIYREEAAAYASTPGFVGSTIAMLGPTLMRWGTEAQKRELVPRLLSAEDTYCQLFSEPGAGSDLAGLATRAVLDGDELVVSGQKVWNSAAQFCSRGMLLVRTDPDVPKHRGISFLLVDMGSPGIEVRPLVQANGAREFNEVFLTDVRVPVANLVGQLDEGWRVARTVLSNEAAFIGGSGGGIRLSDRLLALAELFARTDDPVIRQELAAVHTRERVLAMMGERLLAAIRVRETPPIDPSLLKLYASATRALGGDLAMSIAGAAAVAASADDGDADSADGDADDGSRVTRWAQAQLLYRYAVSIGGGTSEVQRNNLAERALGLPRELRDDHERPWKDVPRS